MTDVRVVDSRRLTGANIHTRAPGAVLELRFDSAAQAQAVIAAWRAAVGEGLEALGWTGELHERRFVDADAREGAELMLTARVDRLYAATDLNEWALARATGALDGAQADARLAEIAERAAAEQQARRGAVELIGEAEARGVMWVIDDEQLSLGHYADAQTWPVGALPGVAEVDWQRFEPRPLALITGTNGKTTTTRILTRIMREHGLRVGNTSTDGLCVDERLVEPGDWTGPGGARAMVRNPNIDVALLEAARGGLLRRGVGVPRADVAVITNVARDHLGEYGIFDLAGMAMAKGVIASVVAADGRIVLGADSEPVVEWARARELVAPVVWFGLDPQNPALEAARKAGGEVWTVIDGQVARCDAHGSTPVCDVADMPLSLAGRARHNVANALAAAAAARALGVPDEVIGATLREFGAAPEDNPGRARVWTVELSPERELELFVDFAHNLAGLAAVADVIHDLAARSQTGPAVCFGMAGDRSDAELRELAAALLQFRPSWVLLREQPDYMRGRAVGETPALLREGLVAAGFDAGRIVEAADEVASIEKAIELGAELVVLLVHTEREGVQRWLDRRGAR